MTPLNPMHDENTHASYHSVMKAWLLREFGTIDSIHSQDVPDPAPAPGQVVLDVEYAALNPADRYLAEGQYPAKPTLPHILGRDGIGKVISVGKDVDDVRLGDIKVIVRGETGVNAPGTFAQRVAVNADSLIDPPTGWSHEESAGATLVYLTAFQAITQWGDLPKDNCVTLVTGASGGVGVAAVQLAKAMGHFVVGLSRDSQKRETVRELGVDLVFDPADKSWTKQLAKEHSRKVNLVVDNVGGGGFNDLLTVMAMNGRISVVGRLAGPVPDFNTASLFFRRLRIGGVAVGTYSRVEAHDAWNRLVDLMRKTNQKPLVDQIFPFEKLPEAFARLKQGPMGKVLLRVKGV